MRKGIIFLCVCCCLCSMVLAGCIGEDISIKINADGSGEVVVSYGITKEGIEILVNNGADKKVISEYKPFNIDGITYYGKTDIFKYSNIEDLNSELNKNIMGDFGFANINVSRTEDGYFYLTLNVNKKYETYKDIMLSLYPNLTDTVLTYLKTYSTFNLNFIMPGNVSYVGKPNYNAYITLKGCFINIDFIGMYDHIENNYTVDFVSTSHPDIYFTDISDNYWGRNPIYSLAYGGIVQGIGNNLFNPEGVITRGEFYTILARAVGLKTYEKDNYWAYGAIYSCGENDLIVNWSKLQNKDTLNKEEWDVPILREEAVSAIYLGYKFVGNHKKSWVLKVRDTDIPDYSFIDKGYAENVLNAYKANIIHGVDENKTFNPKGQLKRVEICQMFYNIEWLNAR